MRVMWKPKSEGSRFRRVQEENISVSRHLDESRMEIQLQTGGHLLQSVKLYPEFMDSAFQLLKFKIISADDNKSVLVNLGSNASDLGKFQFHKIKPIDINGFTFFIAESDQAALEFRLEDHEPSDAGYSIICYLLFPDASMVASFRNHFLTELDQSERKVRQLRESNDTLSRENARLKPLERELQVIKRSRVWRWAEIFRKQFYGEWLSKYPQLQKHLLNRSRKHVRKLDQQDDGEFVNLSSDKISTNIRSDRYLELRNYWESIRYSDEQLNKVISTFEKRPLISIILPVYNPVMNWLQECIDSVLAQRYGNWELCICDDASTREDIVSYLDNLAHPKIKQVRAASNLGISGATNLALGLSAGDYVAFLDHDDTLDPDALFHVCKAISEYDPDCIYTDEDYIGVDGQYYQPHFKPDYSPDTLLSHNYITHLLVVKQKILTEVGLFNPEFDGAQDYDFILRLCEKADSIMHIPKVLYHWRQSENSSSLEVSAKPYIQNRTRQLLKYTLNRRGQSVDVLNANIPHFFHVKRELASTAKVSVIVPFRDEPELLRNCLDSVLSNTSYRNYEILGVNNQSNSPLTYALMDHYSDIHANVSFVDYDEAFNFSSIVNYAVENSHGEYVVLLNNDVEIITWDWLESLMSLAQDESTGAVGGKLFYPDNSVQHAGIVVGVDGYAGHSHKHAGCNEQGYENRLQIVNNVSAVTGAFMMVRRHVFNQVNGFDEENFAVACNDVDFCLRILEQGYWNVFTPYAKAYHLESVSRGYELSEDQKSRFDREKEIFRQRHADFLEFGDPFYNPNLSLENESFQIKHPWEIQS